MAQNSLKYIQIRHWDYWWSVYQCGKTGTDCPGAVEFSLTDDAAGEELFFHFDCYNLKGLERMMREGDFMGLDAADYPAFLSRVSALKRGETAYFIGALYYRDFSPNLDFCNQPLAQGCSLLDLKAWAAPYYAVLFLAEESPLLPEVLISWMTRLSGHLFGRELSVEMAHFPSKEAVLESWKDENALYLLQ